jgi:hypothetical protein
MDHSGEWTTAGRRGPYRRHNETGSKEWKGTRGGGRSRGDTEVSGYGDRAGGGRARQGGQVKLRVRGGHWRHGPKKRARKRADRITPRGTPKQSEGKGCGERVGSWGKLGHPAAKARRGECGEGKGRWHGGTRRPGDVRERTKKNKVGVRSEVGGIGGLRSVSAPSETGRVARRAARLAVKQPQTGSRS